MKEQEKSTENLSIDTAVLTENIKEPSIWVNFFLKVIYLVFLNFIVPFLGFITLLQLLFSIGSKKPNENLVSFSKKISSYINQIINFITYSSDQRPWPFNSFPESSD
ncbi:DUF4389 domain-containing protein [SAR86 cluster bacterium]|nr:DUF4389 domain-containing protein [SAR86 cluster bacterium]